MIAIVAAVVSCLKILAKLGQLPDLAPPAAGFMSPEIGSVPTTHGGMLYNQVVHRFLSGVPKENKMSDSSRTWILIAATFCFWLPTTTSWGQQSVDFYLSRGQLERGAEGLSDLLKKRPNDDQLKFELGIVQFFQAIENLGQSLHRYGVSDNQRFDIPLLRLAVPSNPNPEKISYAKFRKILEAVIEDLDLAAATLETVKSDGVKVPIHLFQIKIDLNGDGKFEKMESFAGFAGMFVRNNRNNVSAKDVVVNFDKADVHWLRGYCHLLRAFCEFGLAYDHQASWDMVAHYLFPKIDVKYPFMEERRQQDGYFDMDMAFDAVAAIHEARFPLSDAKRMERAREHLLGMITQSRKMWEAANQETDNDEEWIPNPKQLSAVASVRVSAEMIETWTDFLDEGEAILNGQKLLPFWRGNNPRRGINLKRVFTEPRKLDLVMWVNGAGAWPYVEEGQVTQGETWQQFQRVFRGEFIGFAVWFN
jgi:hypothetical protein